MRFIRRGRGKPLLLIHGLGGSWRSWTPVLDALAAQRDVIAVDLPGHGATPPLVHETSVYSLADAVTELIHAQRLEGVDVVGSSGSHDQMVRMRWTKCMGARLSHGRRAPITPDEPRAVLVERAP